MTSSADAALDLPVSSLLWCCTFMLAPIVASYVLDLGLHANLLVASCRTMAQLSLLGVILAPVFSYDSIVPGTCRASVGAALGLVSRQARCSSVCNARRVAAGRRSRSVREAVARLPRHVLRLPAVHAAVSGRLADALHRVRRPGPSLVVGPVSGPTERHAAGGHA